MPHLFPKLPLPFRDTLEVYSQEIKDLALVIIGQMGKALKIEEKEIKELFEDGIQMMRMNYYPPCPQPDKAIGLTPHSDSIGLTILLQLNQVEGLQIRKDGFWVPITTNGIYKSIEHRATVNAEEERVSIATFYSPNEDGVVGPASSLISEETPPRFRSIGVKNYFKGLFSQKLDGKSYVDGMRI
ncbi:hypothetical protein VNO80_26973 [Phaseolus coccineus]|uniref:Fe2OG dioxygenase domain-containing protein n=1 Tax=Phaseolus coccineus TaxID=3886 RepID=A0AAN9LJ07_PHACN